MLPLHQESDVSFAKWELDCLYIETSREEYNRWHSRYEVSVQKRKCEKGYRMLSLDYFSDGDDNIPLQNVLASSEDIEKEVGSDMMMQELRRRLAEWKPWANELLDFYLAGKRASATRFFIQKYGISGTTVQKRKRLWRKTYKLAFIYSVLIMVILPI